MYVYNVSVFLFDNKKRRHISNTVSGLDRKTQWRTLKHETKLTTPNWCCKNRLFVTYVWKQTVMISSLWRWAIVWS